LAEGLSSDAAADTGDGERVRAVRKKTRRALFLEEMEQVVPWAQLCRLIEPHYPKAGNGAPGGAGADAARVLFCSNGSTSRDPGLEEALYDSAVMRQFVGMDLGREPVQD
jgi:transposase, IS5 family